MIGPGVVVGHGAGNRKDVSHWLYQLVVCMSAANAVRSLKSGYRFAARKGKSLPRG